MKLYDLFFKRPKELSGHYAPIETNLLTRADRINNRIFKFAEQIKREHKAKKLESISIEDFDKIMRAMQMIISQELTIKGKEEWKWKEN